MAPGPPEGHAFELPGVLGVGDPRTSAVVLGATHQLEEETAAFTSDLAASPSLVASASLGSAAPSASAVQPICSETVPAAATSAETTERDELIVEEVAEQFVSVHVLFRESITMTLKIRRRTPLRKLMTIYCARLGFQFRFSLDDLPIEREDSLVKLGRMDTDLYVAVVPDYEDEASTLSAEAAALAARAAYLEGINYDAAALAAPPAPQHSAVDEALTAPSEAAAPAALCLTGRRRIRSKSPAQGALAFQGSSVKAQSSATVAAAPAAAAAHRVDRSRAAPAHGAGRAMGAFGGSSASKAEKAQRRAAGTLSALAASEQAPGG